MSSVDLKNSTTVRAFKKPPTLPLGVRAARLGLRVLSPRAPQLAAQYAERLFLTARRHRRPAWEEAALENAFAFEIPHDGSFLPAWSWGEGPRTAVLVHGWEGRGSQLASFVEPLVEEGFRVITYDAPGHGDARSKRASVVEHARALASVGRYLGRVHAVVGHSVGGAASLLATQFGFTADRFALVAPPSSPAKFADGFARFFALPPDVTSAMITRVERRYGMRLKDIDACADAARLASPLLVVHDEGDREVAKDEGAAIANAALDGRLVTTNGLGHRKILRAKPVIDTVVDFVTEGSNIQRNLEDGRGAFAETIDGELFFRETRQEAGTSSRI